MVRAGSLQHVEQQKRIKKIVLLSIALICVIAISIGLFRFALGGRDDESSLKQVEVSQKQLEEIQGLEYSVSQPERVPVGYKRVSINSIAASKTTSGCDETQQRFALSKETSRNYIDIYSYSTECSFPRPEDAEAYATGDYSGWISDSNKDLSVLFELTVKQSMMRVETDLSKSDMDIVLKQFELFKKDGPKDNIVLSSS